VSRGVGRKSASAFRHVRGKTRRKIAGHKQSSAEDAALFRPTPCRRTITATCWRPSSGRWWI